MEPIKVVWKDIIGYEGIYQVNNIGEVRSLPRWNIHKNGTKMMDKGIIMKQSNTTTGYRKVELVNSDGDRKSLKVHRLVAQAFLINTYHKPNINHIDGNPQNNIVDNLEWVTQQENIQHAYDIGLTPSVKRTVDHNEVIKDYLNEMRTYDITKKYNITKTVMYGILKEHDIDRREAGGSSLYNIEETELIKLINNGMKNKDIAKEFGCNRKLIGTYKCLLKKEGKINA